MTTAERTTTERSTVIGVFPDRGQADRAIDELRHNGFSYSQMGLVGRGAGSFLDNLKSLFTGQETINANTADDLMKIGMPGDEARYYQGELEANYSILIVKTIEHPEQAFTILRQNGAYDISIRLRIAQPNVAQTTNERDVRPGNNNPHVQPGNNNPNVQPGTYDPTATSGANNPNMPAGTYKPTALPETPGER